MNDLIENLEPITLSPSQSLPLRRMLEDCIADDLKILEKAARRIKELEAREIELKRMAREAVAAAKVLT